MIGPNHLHVRTRGELEKRTQVSGDCQPVENPVGLDMADLPVGRPRLQEREKRLLATLGRLLQPSDRGRAPLAPVCQRCQRVQASPVPQMHQEGFLATSSGRGCHRRALP